MKEIKETKGEANVHGVCVEKDRPTERVVRRKWKKKEKDAHTRKRTQIQNKKKETCPVFQCALGRSLER